MKKLVKNKCHEDNKWFLRLFNGFIKTHINTLKQLNDITQESLYKNNYYRLGETFGCGKFTYRQHDYVNTVISKFLYWLLPQHDILDALLCRSNLGEIIKKNTQYWRFYILEHIHDVKTPDWVNKDSLEDCIRNNLKHDGNLNDPILKKKFIEHSIK